MALDIPKQSILRVTWSRTERRPVPTLVSKGVNTPGALIPISKPISASITGRLTSYKCGHCHMSLDVGMCECENVFYLLYIKVAALLCFVPAKSDICKPLISVVCKVNGLLIVLMVIFMSLPPNT